LANPDFILVIARRGVMASFPIGTTPFLLEIDSTRGSSVQEIRSIGWAHENFIIARHICPTLAKADFSLTTFSEELFFDFPDLDKLNFVLIQRRAVNDDAFSFFCELSTYVSTTKRFCFVVLWER
jgi:hypothetical protein